MAEIMGMVRIQLDRDRLLLFNEQAQAEISEVTGKTLGQILKELDQANMSLLRTLLWAALIHEDSDLAVNVRKGLLWVGKLMSNAPGENVQERTNYLWTKVLDALVASLPADAQKKIAPKIEEAKNLIPQKSTGEKQNT